MSGGTAVTSAARSGVHGSTSSATSSKPVVCCVDPGAVDAADAEQLVGEGEVEEHVGVGSDEDVVGGLAGRLGPAGVDHHHPPAPGGDGPQPLGRVGHLQEAPLRHDRVGSDDDQALGAVDVGEGLGEREAVDLPGGCELVGAVLGGAGVHRRRPESLHEPLGEHGVQDREARRRAHVHGDGIGAVLVDDAADPVADLPVGPVPGNRHPRVAEALHGPGQAVGRRVHLVLADAFDAGEAGRAHVVVVGPHPGHGAVLDRDLEPTQRLADAAERVAGLGRGHGQLQAMAAGRE